MLAEKPISLAQHVIHHPGERERETQRCFKRDASQPTKERDSFFLLASVEESEDHDTLLAMLKLQPLARWGFRSGAAAAATPP